MYMFATKTLILQQLYKDACLISLSDPLHTKITPPTMEGLS